MILSFMWFILFCGPLQVTYASSTWILVVNLRITKICHQIENLSISFSPRFLTSPLTKGRIRLLYLTVVTVKTISTEAGIMFDAHPHMENLAPYRFP